ncbi:maleate isomerase [Hoeflea halophila]|uniref:Maleate isomerase n=1 Tax=Hoeflea halophila TaxID=714899 RepID=A0A286I927_9HYPH|nr:aspartate/glutamate racemase family protein [Hoeflea halophila]SOE16497.1 maleate isomerase [Hoeflea halophila]
MNDISVSRSGEPVRFNDPGVTARFGLIALATDLTSERDLYRQLPRKDVSIHVTRVAFENPTTPANLRKMAPRLTEAAQLLAPLQPLKAICYSCTAASVAIGDDPVRASIQAGIGDVPVITPSAAARMAFAALGVRRIAVLTPYSVETTEQMAAYFTRHGMELTNVECLGLEDDRDMARVSDQTILGAAMSVDTADAEALFISCTGLPAINVIAELETRIGKPVVTSNQASAWAMARLGGFADYWPAQFGQLFGCALPDDGFGEAA